MLAYVIANKEWIFSGAGVSAVLLIGGWLLKSKKAPEQNTGDVSGDQSSVKVEVVHTRSQAEGRVRPESEVGGIVKRFNQVLALMNEKRSYGKYTIASLAQRMKLHSVGELESVFLGDREPSFEFIGHFCECFGVNSEWLIEGKSSPFGNYEGRHVDPLDCLQYIEDARPERIYFIRCDSPAGQTFILLKFADWRYKMLSGIWHISDHVGAGGQSQIFGMYKLIVALRTRGDGLKCGGRLLKKGEFDDLLSGRVFPGSVIEFPNQENPWWDDFTDVHHKYPISTSYESWYGRGFMEAQAIVRWKLSEIAEREQQTR